ncbi:MAG: RluA family pseudouridine synthase [Candidatus Omnitrophica bacterium]|nr:RluA family pseudouridine synthase [Candidatus Omnitrophota bacterium]
MKEEMVFKPNPEEKGMRVDLFLFRRISEQKLSISRSTIQRWIREGKVYTKDLVLLKPHYKVKETDEFKVILAEEKKSSSLLPENIPLKIIYEDQDIAVIDKPAGLVVHPGAGISQYTLVNALLYHFKELSCIDPRRPGIVHRLDKDTSGVMVIAKNDTAHRNLAVQFAQHSVKKEYIAIVKGCVEFDEDLLDLPLKRDSHDRERQKVDFSEDARYAKTEYKTLVRNPHASLIKLIPFTGRTHQLRVHLAFIGYPILGDKKYSKDRTFSRLALHAYLLGFIHPKKNKFIEFISDIPKEFLDYFGLKDLKL